MTTSDPGRDPAAARLARWWHSDRLEAYRRELAAAGIDLRLAPATTAGEPTAAPASDPAERAAADGAGNPSAPWTTDPSGLLSMQIALPGEGEARILVRGAEPATARAIAAGLRQLFGYEHELGDLTQELSFIYEELALLYDLSQAFSETLELDAIQNRAIEQIAETLGVRRVSLLMRDEQGPGLILTAGLGIAPGDLGKARFTDGRGLAWQVIRSGQPLIVNDVADHADYVPGPTPERALLLVPVTTRRGLAGVLTVADRDDGGDFTSKDQKLLAAIAQQMGAVWENARLFRETRELFLNTVEALAAAIDAKDPYTHGHSQRVTAFSVAIAEQMPIEPEERERIRIAALLHDIGKLGVNEAILRKPDRLTADEFGQIKLHPAIGADIMGRVRNLGRFIPGMIDHHERYDGSGYPSGLKAAEISLAGRIIAVADTFDAITSNRPYHPGHRGKPDQVAIDELLRCAGTHFDPAVVAAFMAAYHAGRIASANQIEPAPTTTVQG